MTLSRLLTRSYKCLNNARGAHVQARPSYWHQIGAEPLTSLTIGQLVDKSAQQWGDREAVVSLHQGTRLSFNDIKIQTDRLAAGFKEIGLKPGDRVGIWGPNSIQWYITNLAIARIGMICVNINPAYKPDELSTCLKHVSVKALVTGDKYKSQDYHRLVLSIAPELATSEPGQLRSKELPSLEKVIVMSDRHLPGCYRLEDLLDAGSPAGVSEIAAMQGDIQADEGCNLQFTSGTTGQAKGTLLSHHNIVNNAYTIGRNIGLGTKHHRVCLNVPLFHCFGNVLGVLSGLHFGATLVMPAAGFVPAAALNAIVDERCTVLYGTPTMYFDLLASLAHSKFDVLQSTVEVAVNGGAPCSPTLFDSLRTGFALDRVSNVYGMTETSPVNFQTLPGDSVDQMKNTVGRVHDHLEVKVVDAEGRMVPMGSPGELLVRGYSTMLCYWNQPDKTSETIGADKWLKTGDQFVLREDGYGQVVGRIKDMIIRGGENIFPKEIEQYLETHPKIREVQAFGVPDERMGEELCVAIRMDAGEALTQEAIRAFCAEKLAHFKVPKYVTFVQEFPTTVSGKIQKFRLREKFVEEMTRKGPS